MEDIQFKKNYSSFINPNYDINTVKNNSQTNANPSANSDFSTILRQTVQKDQTLTFSKHALQRMDSRQIQVSPQLLSQINQAVEKAKSKGIKDALIFNGQTAFIVNIPSSTVVTTMSGREMADNVFTNIDGAVIL
jgi:flagellar operon protein